MSALHRLLHLPASRRSYSFFSSRSGGGRYFNSAKPPKTAVVAPTSTSPDAANDLAKDQSAAAASSNATPTAVASAPPSPPSAAASNASSSSTPGAGAPSNGPAQAPSPFQLANAFAELTRSHERSDIDEHYLDVSSKDFKMHQFFALHRPLLLIPQPSTLFRPVAPGQPLMGPPPAAPPSVDASQGILSHYPLGGSTPFESTIDADAEAARQLTRALTMNQAGATISWENTLRHLGLDPAKDADRVGLQEQFDKEWNDVLMDSTKRKRRKKMKKHKLKKRRRATRAERMRLK